MIEMAPVIPRNRWRKRGEVIEAQCPVCKQRQVVEEAIIDGFTANQFECRMPQCYFFDFIRLAEWEEGDG